MMKIFGYILTAMTLFSVAACNPEDRSGERPLKPTVINKSYQIEADSCLLVGEVTSSYNSSLKGCGFYYGNDTLRAEVRSKEPLMSFAVHTHRLQPGTYYAVAFAQNGIGKTTAPDSIYFTIEK